MWKLFGLEPDPKVIEERKRRRQFMPRFRGSVLPKEGGGFTFEMYVTIGPDNDDGRCITLSAPKDQTYLTEVAAMNGMRAMLPDVMRTVCKAMGISDENLAAMDLKRGEAIPLDEYARPRKPGEEDASG